MEVVMPKMGESVNEGTIIKWHKKEGDQVKLDEIILEISTDKVDTEIPSPVEGTLTKILAQVNDTIEVGKPIAVIEEGNSKSDENKSSENKSTDINEKKNEVKEKVENEKKPVEIIKEEQRNEVVSKNNTPTSLLDVSMPKMGESVMEGTVIKWHKKVGDKVSKDEILFEISTDKVDTEVPSPAEGFLAEIVVNEQQTVEVGAVVARLSTSSDIKSVQGEGTVEKGPEKVENKTPEQMHDNFNRTIEEEQPKGESTSFLSPLVMNIIKKENIPFEEINRIKGSGTGNRITKNDVLSYLEKRKSAPQVASSKVEESSNTNKEIPEKQSYTNSKGVEVIPMNNIRQKIMQHMVVSRDTSVHVSAMLEVDMTVIHGYIQSNRDKFIQQNGVKLTYMPFIAEACISALKKYPLVNSSIEGNNVHQKYYVNLGIAVAIEPNGLIVPNIKNAEEKNIIGLSKSINDLAARARTKKLTPDDISEGTFTITNYGVFGTIFGTPIINQPEVAILGVGTVIKKPVVIEVNGQDVIAIKPIMALTLSHDHRLVDGMLGGMFLKHIKDTLENFSF